ncbi:MAG: DUF11 domain-containing protein, partial [Candidatus Kerfeldbacteria bacterium]|nr:DUF11 domain-containing protein [Candidatus Kerfeldbacteria bacterium]
NIDNTAKAYADQVPNGVTSNQVRTVVTTACEGTISGYKFNDLNGNGTWDQGEPALSGWTINLDQDANGSVDQTTVTNGSGFYQFTVLPDTYRVREVPQAGWTQTSTNPNDINVGGGQSVQNVNFGNFQLAKIHGYKFNDLNGNGAWDQNEPALANWGINLTGPVNSNVVTNANGYYAFVNLGPGEYVVSETQQDGWTQTTPATATVTVTTTSGLVRELNFGNTRDTGSLIVHKNVINPDGGEVADTHQFTVTVTGQTNGTIAEGTDAIYNNIPTGTYTVTELPDGSYTFVSYSADNDVAPGAQVLVSKNATTHLTVTNQQKKVEIVVHKNVVAFDGQTDVADNQSFTADVNGVTGAISESQTFSTLVNPGWVTVGEPNVPTNYVLVSIVPSNFQVSSGDQTVHVTITNKQKPSSITGSKFNDLNGNGTWDQGEPGLADWTICMNEHGATDQPVCDTTDVNGAYSFGPLIPGNYHVWEIQQNGWMQTAPQGNLHDVTVGPNETAVNMDFGNFQLGKISGYKFNDLDGNGTWDQGEPGLAGWTIQLSGAAAAADVTDANGYYEFTGLLYGTYSVQEVQQNGWLQTSTNPDDIDVISGTDSQDNNFGNFALGSISGRKFDDLNGNGTWDQGEPTIQGWTIYLNDGDNLSSTQTDANGIYAFSNLGPDSYTISENLVTGWIQTFPPQNGTYLVTLTSGANVTDKDFGNFKLGKISGYKFNDLNGNGSWNQGEPGIAGWGMTLSNGQQNTNIVTDGTGYYEFAGLMVGTYSVTEENRSGWTPTTPSSINDIDVTSGVNSQGNTFGNFQLVSLNGSKFNDLNGNGTWDQGEPGLVGWTINLDQDANGSVDATTVTDGNGDYSFANLGPGTYRLREVQQAGWTQTSANPADVTVVSGTNVNDLDFGNFQYGRIEGYKLNELAQGLANWTICLSLGQQQVSCTSTDQSGHYSFENLAYGTYTVSETQQYGWTQLAPGGNGTHTVLVQSGTGQGQGSTSYDFVNRQNAFEVSIDKIAPETVNAGDQMTYTINWTVTGNTPVSNLIVTDNLPSNVSFVSASNGGSYDNNLHRVTWDLGTKIPADNGSLTITVNVATPLAKGTTLENYAQICGQGELVIEGEQPEGLTTKCDDDTTTTTVNSDVSVNLVKTDSVDPVPAGAQLTYTLAWTVSGNAPIDNLVITDPLPANTQFVSATDGGIFALGTITWNLGAKTPGANGSVSFTVTVASPIVNGTVLTNTAEACIDSFTRTQEEVLHRCDSDDETTVVTSAPLLSIVKSSNITTFVNPGSTAQYTVTITNALTATDTARNVVMTDTLPTGFTFAVDGTTTKSFAIGDLAPGQSATVTYIVNISGTQAAGIYNNLAKAKGDNTNEVSATTPIEVRVPQIFGLETTPDLTIVKTAGAKNAKPGDVVTYTLTVKNIGDGDAENVIITDTLPKDLSFVHATGRTMTWNIGTLKAGHTRIINVDVRVESDAKSGTYTNVATVRSDEVPEKSATADLIVKRPVVLGLATTGVGMLDYAIGLVGMALVVLGILGLRRRSTANNLE